MPDDRQITARLYGGDHDMRVRQEMVLGIGGFRALRAMGKQPVVCHMNEGHSAFCGLERIRQFMEDYSLDYASAKEAVISGTCFTTHTPVPAGNDIFAPALIQHYFASYLPLLKIDWQEFLGLGRQNPQDANEAFCMTVLAIRLSNTSNGVSKLHGEVSRKMWKAIWPELPESGSADHVDHQRRPHALVDGAGVLATLRPLPRRPVGGAAHRSQHLAARGQHPQRRTMAHP